MSKANEIELRDGTGWWGTIFQDPKDNNKLQLRHKKLTDLEVFLCPGLVPYDIHSNILHVDLAPPFVRLTINGLVKHKLKFEENKELVAKVEDVSPSNYGKIQLVITLGLTGGHYLIPRRNPLAVPKGGMRSGTHLHGPASRSRGLHHEISSRPV